MIKHIFILLLLFNLSFAQDYELEDAFPNLYFNRPVLLTYSPDGTDRIFVVEQRGVIKVFPNNPQVAQQDVVEFLNISDRISLSPNSENGLLGLAFHPDYSENGIFFIDYVTGSGDSSFVSKFIVSESDSNMADEQSEIILIRVEQPLSNHNGGMLEFGPDGYLYISFGDGGWQWPFGQPDPANTSQDFSTILAKMLRIDVDNTQGDLNYSIPADNPYYGNDDNIPEEIFASGFRNPWRFSIDQETGNIWLGDVGYESYEEINLVESGKNYGWIIMEGPNCFPETNCDTTGLTVPIYSYPHSAGNLSITGGYVYRGDQMPELYGRYIYGDYGSGRIWALDYSEGDVTNGLLLDGPGGISAFGQDAEKEIYVVYLSFSDLSKIYKLRSNVTSIDNNRAKEHSFYLSQNYPNPFNPLTSIEYNLPQSSNVNLSIYNIHGQKVATLVSELQVAGQYNFNWDASDFASGIYIYQLRTDKGFFASKKLILLK
jgi:glucose/arabinose dehydrogenase